MLAGVVIISPAVSAETADPVGDGVQSDVVTDDVSMTATNSFGRLLTQKVGDQAEQTQENNGNNIFSITMDGNQASVDFETTADAVITVAVFDEEGMSMLSTGTSSVTADMEAVTVTVGGTLPQYYYLRAFMTDAETNAPLCPCFESSYYTKDMQELLAKTVDDFDEETVVNFDSDDTTNFAVFNEDTTIIGSDDENKNIVTLADDENMIYVIENADEAVTSLTKGEIFSYPYGENQMLIVKVDTITLDGTTATITGAELEMEDVFDYVKIESDGDAADAQVDTSEADEGVTFKGVSDDQEAPSPNVDQNRKSDDLAPTGVEGEGSIGVSLDFDIFKQDKKPEPAFSVSAGLKLNAKINFKVYITLRRQYLEFKLDYKAQLYISFTAKATPVNPEAKFALPLGKLIFMPVTGVTLSFTPEFLVEFDATLEFSGSLSGKLGLALSSTEGLKNLSSSPKLKAEAKLTGTIFVGFEFKPEINLLGKLASAKATGKIGFEAEAEIAKSTDDDPRDPSSIDGSLFYESSEITARPATDKDPDTVHDCLFCIKGELRAVASVSVKANLFNSPKLEWKATIYEVKIKLKDFYFSIDHLEFGWRRCPHIRNKITFDVFDQNKRKAKGITADCYYVNKDGQDVKCAETVTDDSGKAHFLLSAGKYTVKFLMNGTVVQTKKFDVTEDAQTIKVKIKANTSEIHTTYVDGVMTVYGKGAIEEWQFENKYNIKSVIIKDGITGIGNFAFQNCERLESVTIADSVEYIGVMAFADCTHLTTLKLGKGLTTIGRYAFDYCIRLSDEFVFPDSLRIIEDYAFWNCESLYDITLPDGLTSIGDTAFGACPNLKSVTIPASVLSIGDGAFAGCRALQSITVHSDNPNYVSLNGDLYNKSKTRLHTYAVGKTDTSFSIPDSVSEIAPYSFCDGRYLESITIPDSVTSIGDYAFSSCTSLLNVRLSNNLTYLPYCIFSRCTSLKEMTVPYGVSNINSEAFAGCRSLERIIIPITVKIIGSKVFNGCINIKDIYYSGSESEWNAIKGVSNATNSYNQHAVTVHYNCSSPQVTPSPEGYEYQAPSLVIQSSVGDSAQSGSGGFIREGLVPGSEALLVAARGSLSQYGFSGCGLLYLAQTTADENGTATFDVDPSLFGTSNYVVEIFGYCAHQNTSWVVTEEPDDAHTGLNVCVCDDCGVILDYEDITPEPTFTGILGDADGDGSISILDVTIIQRYLAAYTVNDPERVVRCGDVNGDILDIIDATLIQRYLASYTVNYPIGEAIS